MNDEQNGQQQNNIPLLKRAIDQFEIPKLLYEREQQKQKEYKEREDVDIRDIEHGISKDEVKSLQDLDRLYGNKATQERQTYQEDEIVKDPYTREQNNMMKHQEYRTIKVGPTDLLKNGQMIQVSVCDPFDETLYHPTDKVIIAKYNNKYYAVGSFCGFDYTNLATGAFLGEKLICPTCGSTYNIQNGFVDQGPSLRNISSFLIQQRDEKVQLVMPEHVPAFQMKNFIKRATIDPRSYVILGDTEEALAAIDALRTTFTGRIIVVPTSPYGQFENSDILNKKFNPINKNETFLVEDDYLDRANVDVVKGEVKSIDLNKNQVVVRGVKDPIKFDKVMIAWGSNKQRLGKEYSNVFYLEDRHSHAKCHNEIIKAKTIIVMGGTFEAYQTAASIRDYLDSIGYTETQIVLMDQAMSEVQQALGFHVTGEIHEMLRDKRISVLMNVEVTKFEGINRIDLVYFRKSENEEHSKEKNVEYYLKPDVVIAENGLGAPKHDLKALLAPASNAENGEPPLKLGIDPQGVPASDVRFSLHYNDLFSPILAVGSCTQYPSFVHKVRVRTNDVKYNMEAAFFAAMNMMDKRVEFRYFPFTSLKIGDTPIYFVGERNQAFHEIVINGSVEDRKFVAYYVYGNEVVGFMTCGYQNLHLYLWEAMKLLIMPPATQLRNKTIDYKYIVKQVLQMRPYIQCKRHEIVKIPSVILAEYDDELYKAEDLRRKVKANIDIENQIQKEKFREMKQKYDREGVEFVQDESDIEQNTGQQQQQRQPGQAAQTRKGLFKPGDTSSGEMGIRRGGNLNMGGADSDNQKNPLTMLLNTAKKTFGGQ